MSRFAALVAAERPALPRPNLGPEPWPEPTATPAWWAVALCAGLAMIVVAIVVRLRRRPRPRAAATETIEGPAPGPEPRVIAWAEAVRDALIARFGASWAARTTEEIVADESVAEAFGAGQLARLSELLRAADRRKFAGPESDGLQGDDWDGWVAAFVATAPAAGASSRINGR